jgi:hypothetical protein
MFFVVTPLKNHVDVKHVFFKKQFEEEVNSFLNIIAKKQPIKKQSSISSSSISKNFSLPKVLSKNVMLNNNNL